MGRLHKHSIERKEGRYNYLEFDSVSAFNAFVDSEINQLSKHNQKQWATIIKSTAQHLQQGTDWYGLPRPEDINALETHGSFMAMPLVAEIQPKIKAQLTQYLEHLKAAVLPKPKMAYNDRGLGVFSFDRAAMALFEQYAVNTSTRLDTTLSQMQIELGHKHLQTSVKSVYAYFQDKQQSYPSLRLYLMAGANARVKGNDLLYVGLACAELVQFMELRGVSVEVNVLIGTSFNQQVIMGCIRVKRFQDHLDKNQLLLLSSDPRYFRYRGFKALIAMSNYFGLAIPSGLGTISARMGKAFVKAKDVNAFVFEQSYSMASAVKEVSQIITDYKMQLDDKS